MTGPTSRRTAPHYLWQGDCDGWRLLDGSGLSVIEERMPEGRAETRHRHARAEQMFYVLSGRIEIEIDGTRHVCTASEAMHVPAGCAHQVRNPGPGDAEFLVISALTTRGDREDLPD